MDRGVVELTWCRTRHTLVGRVDYQERLRTRWEARLQTETSPGGLFPWTPYLTPEPNVTSHNNMYMYMYMYM